MIQHLDVSEESANVHVRTGTGAPEHLVWRGKRYAIIAPPIPWVDRLPWWEHQARMPRGRSVALERRMWQVLVREEGCPLAPVLLLDLGAGGPGGWRIASAREAAALP